LINQFGAPQLLYPSGKLRQEAWAIVIAGSDREVGPEVATLPIALELFSFIVNELLIGVC
jgi:hypothetical protein